MTTMTTTEETMDDFDSHDLDMLDERDDGSDDDTDDDAPESETATSNVDAHGAAPRVHPTLADIDPSLPRKETTRALDVPLTDHEIAGKARSLTAKMAERDAVDAQKRAAVKDYNEQLKDLDEEIDKLAISVRTGKAKRDVPCLEVTDLQAREVRVYRLDTGEVCEPPRVVGFDPVKTPAKAPPKRRREQGTVFGDALPPAPPVVHVDAIVLDTGEVVRLTGEQADAVRDRLTAGRPSVDVTIPDGVGTRTVAVCKIVGPSAPAPEASKPPKVWGVDAAGREWDLDAQDVNEWKAAQKAGDKYIVEVANAEGEDVEDVEIVEVRGDVDQADEPANDAEVTPDAATPPEVSPDASRLEIKLLEDIAAAGDVDALTAWATRSIGARASLKPGPRSRVGKTARARFHALGGKGRFALPSKLTAAEVQGEGEA